MTKLHQTASTRLAPGATTLAPGALHVVEAAPVERWLQVQRGGLWLTRTLGSFAAAPATDCWLRAGQRMRLPAGTAWLAEAQGATELCASVVPAPSVAFVNAPWSWLRQGLRRRVSVLLWAAASRRARWAWLHASQWQLGEPGGPRGA